MIRSDDPSFFEHDQKEAKHAESRWRDLSASIYKDKPITRVGYVELVCRLWEEKGNCNLLTAEAAKKGT